MNMQIHLRLVLVVFIAGLMMIVGCAEKKIRHHQRCRTGTANHPGTDDPLAGGYVIEGYHRVPDCIGGKVGGPGKNGAGTIPCQRYPF